MISLDDLPLNHHPLLMRVGAKVSIATAITSPEVVMTGSGRWLRGVLRVDGAGRYGEQIAYAINEGGRPESDTIFDADIDMDGDVGEWCFVNHDRFLDDIYSE
ncbi:MAG: hypothetical protein ACYSVY_15775 [Planctomycetota bacterium]